MQEGHRTYHIEEIEVHVEKYERWITPRQEASHPGHPLRSDERFQNAHLVEADH